MSDLKIQLTLEEIQAVYKISENPDLDIALDQTLATVFKGEHEVDITAEPFEKSKIFTIFEEAIRLFHNTEGYYTTPYSVDMNKPWIQKTWGELTDHEKTQMKALHIFLYAIRGNLEGLRSVSTDCSIL